MINFGYSEVMYTDVSYDRVSLWALFIASCVFEFKDGSVIYHKNRQNKKFTEEELVFLKLKAISFGKK